MGRVMHYIDSLDPRIGGPVRSVINMSVALAGVGTDVVVAVRHATSAWLRTECEAGAAVVELGGPALPGGALMPSALRALRDLLDAGDVVHVHTMWSLATVQLASLRDAAGIVLCISPCGGLDRWAMAQKRWKKQAFLRTAGRYVLRRTALLHASCESEAEEIRHAVQPFDVRVVPLLEPVDNGLYRLAEQASVPSRNAAPTVLFLGRLHPGKGLELAIRTVAALGRTGVTVRLIVAGSGSTAYRAALETLAEGLGVRPLVEFVGFVSGATKHALLASAHALLLPSEHENYSHVCFESLLMGTPVVTVRGVMTWPELESSGGVIVCEPRPSALAGALRTLLDGDVSTRMGATARGWVREALHPVSLASRYVRAYDQARPSVGVRPHAQPRGARHAQEWAPWD